MATIVDESFHPYIPKLGFVWNDNKRGFVESGGSLMRAILFRAMIDSLIDEPEIRDEAREWLKENFKPFWNLIFGKEVDRVYSFLLELWAGEGIMTNAEARSAISYSLNLITVVDPEGESRFDPLKNKRHNRTSTLHAR